MKAIYIAAIVLAHFAFAPKLLAQQKETPKEWRACSTDADCGVGLVGCYRWIPINKKYLEAGGAFGGHYVRGSMVACKKSRDPGAVPPTACQNNECTTAKSSKNTPRSQ